MAGPGEDDPSQTEQEQDDEQQLLFPETEDDDSDEEELDDGSVLIKDKATDELGTGTSAHFDNLAETLSDSELGSIAVHLVELIDKDKSTQSDRDKLYAEGLKQTGLTGDAPGGADFPGASRATHPMILEASIDSAAQIYKELHPADGPCKIKIVGDKPDEKMLERADRVKSFMNWQLTDEIEEYEEELDQCVSQVPLAGSQFMKYWWSQSLDRPACEYIPQDKLWLPYSEQGFYSAKRKTYGFELDQVEYAARVASGLYREVAYSSPTNTDQTKAEKVVDKIQGEKPDPTDSDQPIELYESYVYLAVEGDESTDGEEAPYVCTIRVQDDVVVALRRNWEAKDERRRAMDWIIEYPYIRWRGSLTLGLMSIIGGLSKASTGALRALLDSAFVNNTPSLMKMKGARFTGQTQQVQPVGINEIEASPGIKDIRQLLMAFPYNPPSPVLYELLGFLVNAGKGVVSTAEEKIADASNQMPMGTALALIEQGGKVFSSIHKRLHKAQKRALKLLYRLNRMYLTKERVIEELGQLTVKPEDFAGPCPIVPVSDPNIFSDAQRFAQIQAVLMLQQGAPQLYELREIHEAALQLLKVPDPDRFLVEDKQPKDLNPVAENMQLAMGGSPSVFPLQNHLAHIQSHIEFYQDPSFGQNPIILPQFVGNFVAHMRSHIVQLYARMCYDAASAAAGMPIDKLIKNDEKHRSALDELLATIGVQVSRQSGKVLEKVLPIMAKAAQQSEQFKMPQPMDPTQAQMAAIEVEKQRVAQEGQLKQGEQSNKVIDMKSRQELDAAKLQQTAADAEAKRQADLQKTKMEQEAEDRRLAMRTNAEAQIAANQDRIDRERIDAENMRNEQDNIAALNISAMRAVDKEDNVGNISSGKGIVDNNP